MASAIPKGPNKKGPPERSSASDQISKTLVISRRVGG
jgi:hypothetical protein